MTVISVIVGSTREGRFSEKPAKWILQQLKKRDDVDARLQPRLAAPSTRQYKSPPGGCRSKRTGSMIGDEFNALPQYWRDLFERRPQRG